MSRCTQSSGHDGHTGLSVDTEQLLGLGSAPRWTVSARGSVDAQERAQGSRDPLIPASRCTEINPRPKCGRQDNKAATAKLGEKAEDHRAGEARNMKNSQDINPISRNMN